MAAILKLQLIKLLLLLLVCEGYGQDLVVTPTIPVKKVDEGGSTFYTCSATTMGEANIRWYNPRGYEIKDTSGDVYIQRINAAKDSVKLYIQNMKEEYAGKYMCRGTTEGNPRTVVREVIVYRKIEFVNAPSPQHPKLNSNAFIVCEVSGNPSPTVSWQYEKYPGHTVTISHGGRYSFNLKGLTIKQITQDDNGKYICRAEEETSGDTDHRDIIVEVHIPPTITQKPLPVLRGTEDRHDTQFRCAATGYPSPQWDFYRDGRGDPLSSTDRMQVDGLKGVIYFRPLKKEDEGQYQCRAYNDVGEERAEGALKVDVIPALLKMDNITRREGQNGVLQCEVRADPPATMTFTKVGSDSPLTDGPQPDDSRVIITHPRDNVLTLTVNDLKPEHMANYTCRAKNTVGENRYNGTITVEFPPNFGNTPMHEIYNWAGRTRNLTCYANAQPWPEWEWWHNRQKIEPNITFKIFRFNDGRNSALSVTVREVDEYWIFGNYYCNASNKYGRSHHSVLMKQADVPGPPANVIIPHGQDTPTAIQLIVTPPTHNGGVDIIGYRVEYEAMWQEFKLNELIFIEDLRPSTGYIFRVRARNPAGVGIGKELAHTTQAIRKPYTIVIISGPVSSSAYEYDAKWDKPLTGGLPIEKYKFQYRLMRKDQDVPIDKDWSIREVEDDRNRPMLSYRLVNLKQNSRYQLQILASNSGSDYSDPQKTPFYFFTAEGVIDPGEVIGDSARDLKWHFVSFVLPSFVLFQSTVIW